MTQRKFDKLSAAQIVAIDKALSEHVAKTDEGVCTYEDGWDDARIAGQVIPDYKSDGAASVGRLRISLGYGRLRTRQPAAKDDPVTSAYKTLEARVTAIEKALFE